MGRAPTGNRKYQIQNIWDTHREIARLAVTGMKHKEIADVLGVTPATVSNTLNSSSMREKLDSQRAARDASCEDVAARIKELSKIAVEIMNEMMFADKDDVKLRAAKDILDRAGYTPVQTIRTENMHAYFTADEIAEIKQRGRELGLVVKQQQQDVIDVPVEVSL